MFQYNYKSFLFYLNLFALASWYYGCDAGKLYRISYIHVCYWLDSGINDLPGRDFSVTSIMSLKISSGFQVEKFSMLNVQQNV